MAWCCSTRAGSRVYISTVAAFLILFGFSPSTSEREGWFGSLDCPETLNVRRDEFLSRPPYVERKPNSTTVVGGLFPGNVLPIGLFYFCRFQSQSYFRLPDHQYLNTINLKVEKLRSSLVWRKKSIKPNYSWKFQSRFNHRNVLFSS